MKKRLLVFLIVVVATSALASSFAYAGVNDSGHLDPSEVNGFDKLVMRPYNKLLDITADISSIMAMVTPAVLFSAPSNQYLTIGVMYAETMALSYGANTLLKYLVNRNRPYMYFDGYPKSEESSGDSSKSFPSRHSTMSFAAAGFTSYVFSKYFPESKWKIPVIALSYSLATATAVFRVASGNHFMTDVLAGAALGTLIGYAIPALHTLFVDKDVEATVSPFSLAFKISL